MISLKKIDYLLRKYDLVDQNIFFAEKLILEARIQRLRPLEAKRGNGGQFTRTDLGPASQIQSSTKTAQTLKATLVWGIMIKRGKNLLCARAAS